MAISDFFTVGLSGGPPSSVVVVASQAGTGKDALFGKLVGCFLLTQHECARTVSIAGTAFACGEDETFIYIKIVTDHMQVVICG